MKHEFLTAALCVPLLAMAATGIVPPATTGAPGSNPAIRDFYTADPAPMVEGGTVYLYCGRDAAKEGEMFTMPEWLCYSSQDLKTWKNEGVILKSEAFPTAAKDSAWASQCVKRGGKYYYYVTIADKVNGGNSICVAIADRPTGPFTPVAKPVVTDAMTPHNWRWAGDIDPTVFIDGDDQAWLCWGNAQCRLAKLKPSMTELDGEILTVDLPDYTEGPWLFRRGALYYIVYPSIAKGQCGERLSYATAPAVTGPWTPRGAIMDNPPFSYTIHPGVIEFKGRWYMFYHDQSLPKAPGGGGFLRSVCIEEFTFNADGTIPFIPMTRTGLTGRAADFHDFAKTPPMGWNSWDSFGCNITEAQAKEQADIQAAVLKPFGWTLFTVDIDWFNPAPTGHDYTPGMKFPLDAYGRLQPATNRFPSAIGGNGFKALADYVHAKGLTFGIHIMRGIARNAVDANTPVLGTPYHARDIANTNDTCCWNPDMYGVDLTKPGAQDYYDSLIRLYADWGVDFIKCDDIARPYSDAQKLEIEALRKAIDKTGRAIVLSLSPGDTPLAAHGHVEKNANMWRISDDFWDRWEPLQGMFGRLHKWEASRTPGSWPDADMLPFGKVAFGRDCAFTRDEQRTCMTLWSIARAPLILGSDLTKLDAWTLSLVTNREVIAANQGGANPRQISRDAEGRIVWASGTPDGGRFVALFNAPKETNTVDRADVTVAFKALELEGPVSVRDVWDGRDLGTFETGFTTNLVRHTCALLKLTPLKK